MSLQQNTENQNLNDTNTNTNTNTNSNNTESRVFSEDYVKALRSEAAENRVRAKNFEKKLKSILGINEDEAVEDWDTVITSYQTNLQKTQQEQLGKVKELLFQAELKKYEGQYNMKLVNKLLDKSKIQIGDDGNVTGLQEALKELSEEYPEIIKNNNANTGANPILDDTNAKKHSIFDTILKTKRRK